MTKELLNEAHTLYSKLDKRCWDAAIQQNILLYNRYLNLSAKALNRYEQILLETDVLTRLGKTVENHVIRSGRPMSTFLPSNNINIKNKKPALSKRSVSSLVDKDVLELLRDSKSITRKRLNNKKRRFNFSRKSFN